MIRDFFTLMKLKKNLEQFVGMQVINFFSQEKDIIVISFANTKNSTDNNKFTNNNIIFSLIPSNSAIYINDNFIKEKKNTSIIFPNILNEVLQTIEILQNDRIIKFTFIKHILYFFPFGGNNSNLFICNKQNNVLYVTKNKGNYINTTFNIKKYIYNYTEFLEYNSNATIFEAITKSNLHLNKYYAIEFLKQENININTKLSDINLILIYNKIIEFIGKLLSYNEFFIYDNNILSLIQLKDYILTKKYNNISEAIKYIHINTLIENKRKTIIKEIMLKLKRNEKKLLDNIKNSENFNDSFLRAKNYKNYAELLMSQTNIKIKSGEEIILLDWNENKINIKLDKKLSLLDNANKYFSKYKKSLEESKIKQQRIPILYEKLKIVQDNINQLNNTRDIKELQKLRTKLIQNTTIIMQQEPQPINIKFRKFILDDNYTLYVGKNAANNDELTMKFAKPNDIWLHARGSSGSHCIIRSSNSIKNEKTPKLILKKAAEIAAYYSDAKNSKYTPVCYTKKKYVHKPKNANVGSVVLQREEIIMVEPKLPDEKNI